MKLKQDSFKTVLFQPQWNTHTANQDSRFGERFRGQKWFTFKKIPDPNLPIDFVTFRALRRRYSHVIEEK